MESWQCSIRPKSRVLIGSLSRGQHRSTSVERPSGAKGESKENFWQSAYIIVHPFFNLALPFHKYSLLASDAANQRLRPRLDSESN